MFHKIFLVLNVANVKESEQLHRFHQTHGDIHESKQLCKVIIVKFLTSILRRALVICTLQFKDSSTFAFGTISGLLLNKFHFRMLEACFRAKKRYQHNLRQKSLKFHIQNCFPNQMCRRHARTSHTIGVPDYVNVNPV